MHQHILDFFYLVRMLFLSYLIFFLTTCDSHKTLHLIFGFVGMHSASAFMWPVTSFHICYWEYIFQISPEEYQICFYSYCIFIASISIANWGPVITCGFDCSFLHRFQHIFAQTFLWLEDTPSKKEYTSQFRALFIHFLFMSI